MSRRQIACDACEVAAWIGDAAGGRDGWCEACQLPVFAAAGPETRCSACGGPLTVGAPRFEEFYGGLQNLVAVLEAWMGRPARLGPLVPERPVVLTDLDPPAVDPGDPTPLREALEALEAGRFAAAVELLSRMGAAESAPWGARHSLAVGIATLRLGDAAAAERAFGDALARDPDQPAARLNRGALRLRRGDFAGAAEDFARAGDRTETRWNRAAGILLEAIGRGPGLPDAAAMAAARAAAGAASDYWSDPTVGRLLFTRLADRAWARAVDGRAADADAGVLRAAALEVEHRTFTDRAMILLGFARVGMLSEAAAVSASLAAEELAAWRAEPFLAGAAGQPFAPALAAASAALAAGQPATALAALAPLFERDDVRHYRVPCLRCGRGSLGVEQVEELDTTPDSARVPS